MARPTTAMAVLCGLAVSLVEPSVALTSSTLASQRSKLQRPSWTRLAVEEQGGRPRSAAATTTILDPVLLRLLEDDSASFLLQMGGGIGAASEGLAEWRRRLLQGQFPDEPWPSEPFFSSLVSHMAQLQLPRFVARHPETVSAVLWSILRLARTFAQQKQKLDDLGDVHNAEHDISANLQEQPQQQRPQAPLIGTEELAQLAEDVIAGGLTEEWGGVMSGVQALDQLFGMGHGLFDLQSENNHYDDYSNDEISNGDAVGFGLEDGIWKHSGWQWIPELQRQIAAMPELRNLVKALGRRPTSEQSDAVHKFVPRRAHPEGGMGAEYDPSVRSSIRGITLSGSISEMVPSEAMLLVKRKHQRCDESKSDAPVSSAGPLRRLFLAKLIENKLLSYESSGWTDIASIPIPRPRYRSRLPSAPGGPIMVCLDTSFSMMGMREHLSKAVVLACVAAAHKQRRDIQVVAFSSTQNVMEAGQITADAPGVRRLLEFLSCSFGGGTDVTGALKHAMAVTSLNNDEDARNDVDSTTKPIQDSNMEAADILLVTDGEIPDPPVSKDIMLELVRLTQRSGVHVHGLLVGKRESVPLSKLCTHIHDFLIGYETASMGGISRDGPISLRSSTTLQSHVYLSRLPTAWRGSACAGSSRWPSISKGWKFRGHRQPRCRNVASLTLRAKYDDNDESWGKQRKNRGNRLGRWEMEEDEFSLLEESSTMDSDDVGGETSSKLTNVLPQLGRDYSGRVQIAIRTLRDHTDEILKVQAWNQSSLDEEKAAQGSCWHLRGELQNAIERVKEGLVEREEEARLVVLGMASREHVLFLGPPGTGKSILGRRLSQLCGGQFFQRLLTRFTTPEEIFGPLSLRALENDEYRRKTDGFLPTASVAFLDEIFKANSAILNTLLTILNERQFDNGAGVREECPIRCVVGASNELPESDDLDALYDRFLLRSEVLPVSDDGVMRMLRMSLPGVSQCDDNVGGAMSCNTVFSKDLDQVIHEISFAADRVEMGDDACLLIRDLRNFMREELDTDVSDRRLVKATRLLKVSAACHGRTRVDALDCLLLQHMAWRVPEHRAPVKEWLWNNITPGSSSVSLSALRDESLESAASTLSRPFRILLDGLRDEAVNVVRKTSGDVTGSSGARQAELAVIQSIIDEISRISKILQQRSSDLARHTELLRRATDHIWLEPEEAKSAQQQLLPRAVAFQKEIDRALADACALGVAVSSGDASPANDMRMSVVEGLWEEGGGPEIIFSDDALEISMKEAKAKYDPDTFRKWKRAKKKANK